MSEGGPEPSPTVVTARRVLIVFNLGMPVFLAYTGAVGILYAGTSGAIGGNPSDPATKAASAMIFQGIYMLIFAALLFIYEAVQLCPCEMVDTILKRNFGFMYGVYGKAIYTLMIGIFAYGLAQPQPLVTACAVIVAAYGPISIVLHFAIPGIFEQKQKYVP